MIVPVGLFGQLPNCNLYHFTIDRSDKTYEIKEPVFLTEFNENGYNNQPYFFGDDLVYFTSNYYQEDQTEISSMDLRDEKLVRISYTPESEYSPTVLESDEAFSCVRVESDGTTQSLMIYPKDGMGIPKRYMNNTSNIGYHAWINESTLALFLVEEPSHLLAIADAQSERRNIILDNIGRTLKVSEDQLLYFVHKIGENEWYIKNYDNKTNKLNTVCKTLSGVEDFELMEDGSILSTEGSKLYFYNPYIATDWKLIKDLKSYGISQPSRIAVRKDRMIIVSVSE